MSKPKINPNPNPDFQWPVFKTDYQRIKAVSEKYRDFPIEDAMSKFYGTSISACNSETINQVPVDPSIGQIINFKIQSVSKDGVIFEGANVKKTVVSGVNLWKYKKFRQFIPSQPIQCRVTNVTNDKVTVDPIEPMLSDWLMSILKSPRSQYEISNPHSLRIKNLQLTKGGFMGRAVIPEISEFLGEDYEIDAFVPGSQIVLNITNDFEQFIGTDIDAFAINVIYKQGNPSLICSRKEYLKFKGDCIAIGLFNNWCEANKEWMEESGRIREGIVTGVLNSSKKCGVFVEVPELSTTGMIAMDADKLVAYKSGDRIDVRLNGYDEETYYNDSVGQFQHVEPYTIKQGCLTKITIKPIFILV